MTNPHGSSTDWVVHPRVPYEGTNQHEHGRYYLNRRKVVRYITENRRAMNLTGEEWTVLIHIIGEAPLAFPWKYVLMGTTDYAARRFDSSQPSAFRRAVSGLRRKGFLNAGKVEEKGVGRYRGKIVRHPVLEATPKLIGFCLTDGLRYTLEEPFKKGPPLVGNLKTTVLKRDRILPPQNPDMLKATEFIYAPENQEILNVLSIRDALAHPNGYLSG